MNKLRNKLKTDFSQIPNEMITDTSISAGALRVLLYLFTKPDEWNVYNKDICKQLKISEQTLTKYWKALINSKWLRRERLQSEDGKLQGGYIYRIGTFNRIHTNTVSIQSTVTVKSIDHSNNKPIKKQVTSSNNNLPETLNLDAFKMWCSYKGKSYSAQGKALSQNKLMKHSKDIQMQMVENSIMNNYKGLFEIKQQNKPANNTRNTIEKYFDDKQEVIDVGIN